MDMETPQFSGKREDWPRFFIQLESYFNLLNITDTEECPNRRQAYLLGCTGPHSYDLAKVVCFPHPLRSKTYEEICELMRAWCEPYRSIHLELYKFDTRFQMPSESFEDYYADLKRLATTCEFGQDRDKQLLRRILCGIRDISLKRQLLSKFSEELTLEVAVREITAWEHVYQTVPNMGAQAASSNSVQANTPALSPSSCFRCGNPTKHNCPKRNSVCRYCHKRGHIASVCLLKRGGQRVD